MKSDLEYDPAAEPESESEGEVKKSRKRTRTRTCIETHQLQEEQDIAQHFQERAEKQRDQSASGFQAVMDKLYQDKKLSAHEQKVVWSGMRREMTATVKRLMKLHAACGGTLLFMYAPPLALADEEAKDDPKMFQAFRMMKMNTEQGEMNKFLDPALVQQLEHNFTDYRYTFNSNTEPAASIPLPSAGSSSAEDERIPMTDFAEMLGMGIGDGNKPGNYSAFEDVMDDNIVSEWSEWSEWQDAAEAPAPAPAPAPVPVAVAVAVEAPAPAPAAAGKKAKKQRKGTGDPNELTEAECVQVNRIKKLFLIEGKSLMEYSCPKPEWITYEGYAGLTETSVTTINQPGTSKFYNCTTSLSSFLDKGYYKNVGLTDLSDFVKWFKDNSSTTGPRAELKEKLGGYLTGRLFPIVNRWLFHYAAKHGGDEGDENARMERVIKAFKDVVNSPEA